MTRKTATLRFLPSGTRVTVPRGSRLLEAAVEAGAAPPMPCGGAGICGKCRLRLIQGVCPPSDACRANLTPAELDAGWRLACQVRVDGDWDVEEPAAGPSEAAPPQAAAAPRRAALTHPAVVAVRVRLTPPAAGDARSDIDRLRDALGPSRGGAFDLGLARRLPALLRQGGFEGAAVLADGDLVDFMPGAGEGPLYGAALDIGTTSVAVMLVELGSGREAGLEAVLNPQTSVGDDVLSRIRACREDAALEHLRAGLLKAVNGALARLARAAGTTPARIVDVAIAGNTAMQQIACGLDPAALGEWPFVAVFQEGLRVKAADLGLAVHPAARAYVFPQIGGFIGGDTAAGMLACGLRAESEPTLLVDIGTNGELVLAGGGRLTAASAAAGPAFEGARISRGQRAAPGAIEGVAIQDEVLLQVIGSRRPAGLCGSGLIDAAAELLRRGLLHSSGRLSGPGEAPPGTPPALAACLTAPGGRPAFRLAGAAETGAGDLLLTQRDVRELQLAKAAIAAATTLLLRENGLRPGDLRAVYLAGAFGNFIRRHQAQRIGLLPVMPPERIRFVGNAALEGARLALLQAESRKAIEGLVRRTRQLDVSSLPDFQDVFSEALPFPDPGAAGPAGPGRSRL